MFLVWQEMESHNAPDTPLRAFAAVADAQDQPAALAASGRLPAARVPSRAPKLCLALPT